MLLAICQFGNLANVSHCIPENLSLNKCLENDSFTCHIFRSTFTMHVVGHPRGILQILPRTRASC